MRRRRRVSRTSSDSRIFIAGHRAARESATRESVTARLPLALMMVYRRPRCSPTRSRQPADRFPPPPRFPWTGRRWHLSSPLRPPPLISTFWRGRVVREFRLICRLRPPHRFPLLLLLALPLLLGLATRLTWCSAQPVTRCHPPSLNTTRIWPMSAPTTEFCTASSMSSARAYRRLARRAFQVRRVWMQVGVRAEGWPPVARAG